MSNDIFNRLKNREAVPFADKDYGEIGKACAETRKLVNKLNASESQEEMTQLLSEITDSVVSDSVRIFTPFHINYGKNTKFGKNIFINFDCVFLDLGGIEIGDNVLIAPGVKVLSEGHPVEPKMRQHLTTAKICIKKNAWIGANATILQGVTIGENSVVASGAVVSSNVPDNVVVGGIPAKIIKHL